LEHISFFLKKFENLGAREFLVREIVSGIIEKKCGIKILEKNITYDRGTLIIKGSRSLKSELFMKKVEIVGEIENSLSKTKVGRII
jgi:hypothetical protein